MLTVDRHHETIRIISFYGAEKLEFCQLATLHFSATHLLCTVRKDTQAKTKRPVKTNCQLNGGKSVRFLSLLILNLFFFQQAFVLACIYPNTEPSSVRLGSNFFGENGYSTSEQHTTRRIPSDGYELDTATSSSLCSASKWSIGFSPNKLISRPDSGVREPDAKGGGSSSSTKATGPVARPKTHISSGNDMFTVSLIAVIVGLGIVAIICIAVGCVMRRRRPKTLRSDMSITLVNSDNTLKTPLMNAKLSTFSETNGNLETSQTIFQASDNAQPITGSANCISHTPTKIRSAIALSHLPEHVAMLKMNSGLEMSEEYESIESGTEGLTWKYANMEENRPKNRYANVVAYDHSRVLLPTIADIPGSDYINANYIDGYQRQKAYIATQGPLPETFYDFWRMIWDQNSRIIVMMTRLEERARVKCDQYWPTRGTEAFRYTPEEKTTKYTTPVYTVTLNDTSEYAYYTLRTFILRREAGDGEMNDTNRQNSQSVESREIKQFQFTAWPDYGTPDYPQPLLLFIRRVTQVRSHMLHQLQQERLANGDSYNGRSATHKPLDAIRPTSPNLLTELGPTVVHCSAGVGRTGAFIVIDSQLERLRYEKSVDIFGSVGRMRAQRNFMVQTEEQYTFLYDVFVEAATVYGTEVTAHGLYNHVVKLRQIAPSNLLSPNKPIGNGIHDGNAKDFAPTVNQSGLEMEFKRLNVNLVLQKQFTSAMLPENRLKNRTPDILPYEANRVFLPIIRGLNGSDYINASFIDGYRKKRAYISAQTPLPNTTDDFWRLIWEHNSPIIVLMQTETVARPTNTSATGLPVQSDSYWPMERSTRYQHLLVEPMVEYTMPHFILREFRLTDTRDGQSRTLRQFQLLGWPQDSVVPKSAEAMIDLIGQVHKTQSQFGQDGPITVHCSTGSGRSAVFICLSLLLERMRCEGMVDIFITTRMLRTQRVDMIQTPDQYAFCYAATLEYLASFDHYTS
ncbi:receptor-type tyrosine-protein phosphatase delta [Clonorchis sinensis]|uniref:protein-tyrosine-phosphatase n=2 Tax=Clonorchis sinensis TaxID=79923 RepID=G7YTF7_CLOSI|nr:receptor-type tyrosine-protein phosphatase delta [Clonorchis sinensis]